MKCIDVLSAVFAEVGAPFQDPSAVAEALTNGKLVWEDLIRIAQEQAVLPAFHERLAKLGAISKIPAEIASFLLAVENLNADRNRAILGELIAVAALLNSVGIEPVLLKGVAYCVAGVYPNPGSRYLWDIDLLIPPSQFCAALEVLLQNGFEPQENSQLGHFRHHHPPLQRHGAVHIELHHSLGMGVCRSLLPAPEVLESSVLCDLGEVRVRLPSPEHLMVHLIMHSQIQHPYNERIWPPLRAMYDLVLLRRRFNNEIDWNAIQRRFRKARQFGVLALHLLQLRETLGIDPPFQIELTSLIHMRWLHRRLLRRFPSLRFLDPIYMYSTVLVRRLRLLRNVLDTPGGWRCLMSELAAPAFYKRLVTDIIEGYGR